MAWRWWVRLQRSLLRRRQDDRDLDDELRFHVAEETQLLIGRGVQPAEAERAARLALGSIAAAKEATRAVWVSTRFEQLLQDLRAGSRIVTKSPGLTCAAVVLIALVIGGNTTIFSIVHGVLKKPAAGVTAERLVTLTWTQPPDWIEPETSYANYADLSAAAQSVRLAGSFVDRMTLSDDNRSHAVWGAQVSSNYFDLLGIRLALGRAVTAADETTSAPGVTAVISHLAWQMHFNGDAGILDRSVLLNGQAVTIVGVAAAPFRGSMIAPPVDVWVPFAAFSRASGRDDVLIERQARGPMLIGQLRSGQTIDTAQAELSRIWARLKAAYPELERQNRDVLVLPYSGTAGGNGVVSTEGDTFLAIFSVITVITLLIVCANVANLLIGRAIVRQREMALRQSLGASRARIVRLLFAEGLALALLAWSAACVFAWWVSRLVVTRVVPADVLVQVDVSPDWAVALYALALAAGGMVAFTVAPALRAWRQPLLPWLKAGEQGIVQGRSRLSGALVVLQLAFSVLLLVAAGLAYRSVSLLGDLDLGYSTRGHLLATVRIAAAAEDARTRAALVERLRERLAAIPGVVAVSYGSAPREFWRTERVQAEGAADELISEVGSIGPDYLAAFGLVPRAGTDMPPTDASPGARVLITESLATALWPGQSPLGRTLVLTEPQRSAEVVGVAPDAYFGGWRTNKPRVALVSTPEEANVLGETTFHIRHAQPLDTIVPGIHREVRNLDARVPVVSVRTLETQLSALLSPIRLVTILLALFGCGSLLIAAIGQYAAVSFDMRRRVREVGVRMALGASSAQVLVAVLREGFRSTAIGLTIGFVLSAAVATAVGSVLYGVTPTDAVTYGGVFALLTGTSLLACLLPARQTSRIDPIRALRYE